MDKYIIKECSKKKPWWKIKTTDAINEQKTNDVDAIKEIEDNERTAFETKKIFRQSSISTHENSTFKKSHTSGFYILNVDSKSKNISKTWFSKSSTDINPRSYKIEWNPAECLLTSYYEKYFFNSYHLNYICNDKSNNKLIVSVCRDENYRLIIRSTDNCVYLGTIDVADEDNSVQNIVKKLTNNTVNLVKVDVCSGYDSNLKILHWDQLWLQKKFKFGIILQKRGQKNEEEMLDNVTTLRFEQFLKSIATKVCLKGFKKHRGELDVVNNTSGKESFYATFNELEIMFHVSTMMNPTNKESDRLLKKRFIGNDVVVIVFRESDTFFEPSMITSKMIYVFIVITMIPQNWMYSITIYTRDDVKDFGPIVPNGFNDMEHFRQFLYSKLVNAYLASMRCKPFFQLNNKSKAVLLTSLYDDLKKEKQKIEKVEKNVIQQNVDSLKATQIILENECQAHKFSTNFMSFNDTVNMEKDILESIKSVYGKSFYINEDEIDII